MPWYETTSKVSRHNMQHQIGAEARCFTDPSLRLICKILFGWHNCHESEKCCTVRKTNKNAMVSTPSYQPVTCRLQIMCAECVSAINNCMAFCLTENEPCKAFVFPPLKPTKEGRGPTPCLTDVKDGCRGGLVRGELPAECWGKRWQREVMLVKVVHRA